MPKISSASVTVLMATFNGQEFIRPQIESILNQSHSEIRLQVIDDCSTDSTYAILRELQLTDSRISLLKNSENIGVVRTFEKLLGMVTGRYFCLSDQDDVWVDDKIEKELTLLLRGEYAVVYSDLEVVDKNLSVINGSMWDYSGTLPIDGNNVIPFLLRNPASGCTILGNSQCLQQCLPFPEGVPMHDWWLVVCGAMCGSVGYLSTPTVKYRQHTNNELGAVNSTFKGFLMRLKKGGGGFMLYASYRSSRRIVMTQSLLQHKTCVKARILLLYLRAPWLIRLMLSPGYLIYLIFVSREMGFRSILLEVGMNMAPRMIGWRRNMKS